MYINHFYFYPSPQLYLKHHRLMLPAKSLLFINCGAAPYYSQIYKKSFKILAFNPLFTKNVKRVFNFSGLSSLIFFCNKGFFIQFSLLLVCSSFYFNFAPKPKSI